MRSETMLESLTVKAFKSLGEVTVHLGQVNVFAGPNGSGKSNLLDALGVLAAAADGRVDDQALLSRGVRSGPPTLLRTAFPRRTGGRTPSHISFSGSGGAEKYEVSLHNPLNALAPAWRFRTEVWDVEGKRIVGRGPRRTDRTDPARGLAALRAAEWHSPNDRNLLRLLQDYVIYSPDAAVLRGTAPETRPRDPLGLSGGNLPQAASDLLRQRRRDQRSRRICGDVLELVDWVASFGSTPAIRAARSPDAAGSDQVISFRDRYMRGNRSKLSAHDVSDGALFALHLAVLSGHRRSPRLCAVDNAGHGLNPRTARTLAARLCEWYLSADGERQLLLTTHNPTIVDGLPLKDDRVRLFAVSRTRSGRTSVRRIETNGRLARKAKDGWSLSRLWVMGHLGGMPDV